MKNTLRIGFPGKPRLDLSGWVLRMINNTSPAGILLRGGPKFKLNPDFITRDLRGSHLLSGKYIRPELVFSIYEEDVIEQNVAMAQDNRRRSTFSSVAFVINYGRQYILADIMSLDWHFGVGYGFDNTSDGKYHYSHTNGDSSFPVAISGGFTIGVLLNGKSKESN